MECCEGGDIGERVTRLLRWTHPGEEGFVLSVKENTKIGTWKKSSKFVSDSNQDSKKSTLHLAPSQLNSQVAKNLKDLQPKNPNTFLRLKCWWYALLNFANSIITPYEFYFGLRRLRRM